MNATHRHHLLAAARLFAQGRKTRDDHDREDLMAAAERCLQRAERAAAQPRHCHVRRLAA